LVRGVLRSTVVIVSFSLLLLYTPFPNRAWSLSRFYARTYVHHYPSNAFPPRATQHSHIKQATARHVCSAPSSCMHINLVWPDQPDIHRIYIHTMPEPSTQNSAFNMQQYTQVARASKPGPKCDKVTFLCKSSRADQDPQQNGARHTTLCCSS
jgi:hypothetical protein